MSESDNQILINITNEVKVIDFENKKKAIIKLCENFSNNIQYKNMENLEITFDYRLFSK
jgi:hypothetical protein